MCVQQAPGPEGGTVEGLVVLFWAFPLCLCPPLLLPPPPDLGWKDRENVMRAFLLTHLVRWFSVDCLYLSRVNKGCTQTIVNNNFRNISFGFGKADA